MGRRTGSTKTGRYMNPADQARKMARKRELKKNKKQRTMVRQSVLKNKDPEDLLRNIIALDEMEFNYENPPTLSEKVISDKRIKMRETFFRIMGMHRRENDTEMVNKMRKMLEQYEVKRAAMERSYLTAKFAAETDPSDIPLPSSVAPPENVVNNSCGLVPIQPTELVYSAAPVLFNAKGEDEQEGSQLEGPGVPAGPPPSLSDIDSENDDEEAEDNSSEAEEQKEIEEVSSKGEKTVSPMAGKYCASDSQSDRDLVEIATRGSLAAQTDPQKFGPFSSAYAELSMHFPMPTPRALTPQFLNPPSLGDQQMMRPSSHVTRPFIGPVNPPVNLPEHMYSRSSVDSFERSKFRFMGATPKGPIIEAKPQLRNMQQEVTRLVPTVVRVKKTAKYQRMWTGLSGLVPSSEPSRRNAYYAKALQQGNSDVQSKDEIYEQFMAELNELV